MKKQRVSLVVPPAPINASELVKIESSMEFTDNSSPSLGLGYVAKDLIHNGFDVNGYDARFDQHESLETIANRILECQPNVVGFTTTTSLSNNVIRLSNIIKKLSKDTKIVVGGSHASLKLNSYPVKKERPITEEAMNELGLHTYSMAEALLRGVLFETENFPLIQGDKLIDAVVIGPCFDWAHKLFEALSINKNHIDEKLSSINGIAFINSDNSFVYTGERLRFTALSDLPSPAIEIFPMSSYLLPGVVIGSHGCPCLCSYCTCPATSNGKYSLKDPETVIREILRLKKEWDVDKFKLNDDAATSNGDWINRFSDLLIDLKDNKGLSFDWSCFARVDQVDLSILKKIFNAGCVNIQYGVEVASDDALKAIHKGVTMDQIINAYKIAVKSGIPIVRAGMVFGFYFDNQKTLSQQYGLIKELYEIGGPRADISVASLTPYPGCLEGDRAIQGYYLHKKTGQQVFRPVHFDFDKYIFHEVIAVNDAFPRYSDMNLAYNTLFGATQELGIKVKQKRAI